MIWTHGATVARSTPDRKVVCSNRMEKDYFTWSQLLTNTFVEAGFKLERNYFLFLCALFIIFPSNYMCLRYVRCDSESIPSN